jgi:ATP-dependent DNA helicase DinG
MARAVADTLEHGGVLLVEAPTGSGKSLAYLAAAAALIERDRNSKAVVSTGTIVLQEQLSKKDVPLVADAVGGINAAVLKGFGRFLCLLKLRALHSSQMPLFAPPHEVDAISRWAASTETGDQDELPYVPSWWGEVAADHSDCLGGSCSLRLRCFPLRARDAARKAQLVVANHHLTLLYRRFGSDTSPVPADAPVIIDEAHDFVDVATDVFGNSCTDFTFVNICHRAHGLVPTGTDPIHEKIEAAIGFHRSLMNSIRPGGWEPVPVPKVDPQILARYISIVNGLVREIADRPWDVVRDRSGISPAERAALVIQQIQAYLGVITAILSPPQGTVSFIEPVRQQRVSMNLYNAPVEVGPHLQSLFGEDAPPAILTSATLAAAGSFAHIKARLGIARAKELVLPPVFNYREQVRYYIADEDMDPNAPDFTAKVARQLEQILRATRGRALVLFTSYQHLREVADMLKGKLPYTLLVQDQSSTSDLLRRKREDVHSVLLATSRFWQGIDVPGEAISAVVVVRLPFEVPTHPLTRARYDAAVNRGENAFYTVVLPEAVIKMRQGVGRLIRTTTDRGVVAILDGRVRKKAYGRIFLRSLPRAPEVRSAAEIREFLDGTAPAPEAEFAGARSRKKR